MTAGRAGLLGADEEAARLRQESRLLLERAAEARSRLQSTHVSAFDALRSLRLCSCFAQDVCMPGVAVLSRCCKWYSLLSGTE